MGKGLFTEHKRATIAFDTKPGINDRVWMDQSSGIIYNYDESRGIWLSASKHIFEFARKGASNGMYIPLLGDLDSIDDVYTTGKPAVITSIYCRSVKGNNEKEFELRKNGQSLFAFSYDNSLEYNNNSLQFEIESIDEIQVYVSASGSSIRNTVCRVETAWRYNV